jgi:hypothetical protein
MGFREITSLIEEAARLNPTKWVMEGNSQVLRRVDMGRIIGTDLTGKATRFLRVVVDETGN